MYIVSRRAQSSDAPERNCAIQAGSKTCGGMRLQLLAQSLAVPTFHLCHMRAALNL